MFDAGATLPASQPAARAWERHTLVQKIVRLTVWIAIAAAIVQSLRNVEVIPEFLHDAPEQMGDLVARMWPVDFAYYPQGVHAALVETLHIASLATLLSLALAV